MNSGELPLKTRRKVSLAPDGAGTENAAEASIEATAISRENRSREIFMVLSERKAIKVVCDRKRSKSCATCRCASCPRLRQHISPRKPKTPPRLFRLQMAQRHS